MLIIGKDGFNKLQKGYEVNASDIKVRAFTVAADATTGIAAGELLAYTDKSQVYKAVSGTSDKIAGICLATNVKTDIMFPQSTTDVKFMPGEKGGCLVRGEVAVALHGTAPTEGAAVYYDLTNRAFTTVQSGNVACPNMEFRGRTEGNVTVVNVRY